MFANGRLIGSRRGGALIMVLVLVVVCGGILTAMMSMHMSRNKSAEEAESRLARTYAAEAGLERARLEVNTTGTWLATNKDRTAAVFTGGSTSFTVNGVIVQVKVTAADVSWYLVQSTATANTGKKNERSTVLGMTGKGGTVFSDYARFVSLNDLSVGANAKYDGKVYANGALGINGDNITFYDTASCHGAITYGSSSNKSTCKFYKSATPGVPSIALPEAAALQDIAKTAPAGAQIYDYQDAAFKAKFQAATGSLPGSDTTETITLNKTTMTVVTTSGTKTMTETNVPIPHEGALWSRGNVTVQGNISRRFTVSTPANIYVNGSVRYVDDSGGAQWQLRKKTDNSLAAFDTPNNTWTPTTSWDANYNYEEAADWDARCPLIDGEKANPALGIVSGSQIYLNGTQNNREVHAALFTSGGVVNPNFSGTKPNLLINGSIITTGTNPLSGSFSCRIYAYDPNLKGNPPPGFPGGDAASFHNWQVISGG